MFMWIYSFLFSIFLFLWTTTGTASFSPESYEKFLKGEYAAGVFLIAVVTLLVCRADRHGKVKQGLLIIGVLLNIGLSAYYQCAPSVRGDVSCWKLLKDSYLFEMLFMFLTFSAAFMLVRYTRIYRTRVFNYLAMLIPVICVFGARFFGTTGGSSLRFCAIMIFAEVLLCYCFAAAYFFSLSANRYVAGNPGMVSYNLIAFLLWVFLLYAGCIVDNEFGLILVLLCCSTTLFFIKCRNRFSKFLYTVASAGGGLLAVTFVRHISDRVKIFLDPAGAYSNPDLKQQAESMLFLFRHWREIGWWANGPGHLSAQYFPNRTTDHLLIMLFDNGSVFLVMGVIFVGALLVRFMLTEPEGLSVYDKNLNLICGFLTGVIMILNIVSCTTITIGIPFPFVSKGASINCVLLMSLVGIHTGLVCRQKGEEYDYADLEEEEF